MALAGEFLDQIAGILPPDRSGRRQNRHQAGARPFGCRLDRRDGADEDLIRIGLAQAMYRQRRGRVAGDDRECGTPALDEFAEQRHEAIEQRRLFPRAIGKSGVVGDIDVAVVRQENARLLHHRKAANAGIEEQDRSAGHYCARHRSSGGPEPRGRRGEYFSSETSMPRNTAISSVVKPGRVSSAFTLSSIFGFLSSVRK